MARQITTFIGAIAATAIAAPFAGAAETGAGRDMLETYASALGVEVAAVPRAGRDAMPPQDLAAVPHPDAEATPHADIAEGPRLALAAAPLPRDELGGMRAGFAMPGGISVAFGFDIETRLAGVPVQRMTLPLTELGPGAPQVQIVEGGVVRSVQAGTGPIVSEGIFNGGGTRISTVLDGGITSLVQNSRDGQVVQRSAAFQVDIAGMARLLDAAATRRVIDDALGARIGRGR
ncbi:hypothetical protein [Roseomonas sp. HF4]|uniref:hypothetical protein n=1 Tax=Roseomonas sp. HF4 TaxID=2562313 RepID=UPI0010BFCBD2|nr:hypothetical protein [Roseomonas sp. HF4]